MRSFFPLLPSAAAPPLLMGGPMMAAYLAITRATRLKLPLWASLFMALAPLGVAAQWAARWGLGAGALALILSAGLAWLAPRDSISIRKRLARALRTLLRNCIRRKNALSSAA